ncbi:MAG: hypothetical protein GXO77_09080, partial [Calditrichaeota bacterium]|nr:hypothetical protein [Calditrichota bacterium]
MKPISAVLLVILSFIFLNAQTSLPPYHWTWDYLYYLKTSGALSELNMTNRPWYRQDISQALNAIDESKVNPELRRMLNLLKNEFKNESRYSKALTESKDIFSIQPGLYSILGGGRDKITSSYKTRWEFHPFLQLQIGPNITLYSNIRVFN